jgi:pimeloyl-ACP methyl ester carboxylesterase
MESLAALDVPTLVLAGTEDAAPYTTSGAYLERKMPNARFVAIEGGKHMMHEESHADEIAACITGFVDTLPPAQET